MSFDFAVCVRRDLSASRNGNVLAVHEQKERRSREEHQRRGDVPSAAYVPDCPQSDFVFIDRPNVVNVHVRFSATSHPTFRLGLGDRRNCRSSTGNDYYVANLDFIKDFKILTLRHNSNFDFQPRGRGQRPLERKNERGRTRDRTLNLLEGSVCVRWKLALLLPDK